jgi:hypothetical protein
MPEMEDDELEEVGINPRNAPPLINIGTFTEAS